MGGSPLLNMAIFGDNQFWREAILYLAHFTKFHFKMFILKFAFRCFGSARTKATRSGFMEISIYMEYIRGVLYTVYMELYIYSGV